MTSNGCFGSTKEYHSLKTKWYYAFLKGYLKWEQKKIMEKSIAEASGS